MNIIFFGHLTEIAGNSLVLEDVSDTDELVKELHSLYPILENTKYIIAVNKKMISDNTILHHDSTIALLPPFSGG